MNFHSIWNMSQSTSWKLQQFWLVECFCDFSLWRHIWLSPKRSGVSTYNSRWITRGKDHLQCSLLHLLLPWAYTLLKYSLFPGSSLMVFFFRTSFQGKLPNHRKGKHYNLLLTVNCTISLGERIREMQRGKKENGRVRIWQRRVSDFYTIRTLDIKYRRTTWE